MLLPLTNAPPSLCGSSSIPHSPTGNEPRQAQSAIAVLVSGAKLRPRPLFSDGFHFFIVRHERRWLFHSCDNWWAHTGNDGFFIDPNTHRPAPLHVFAALIQYKYYAWVCEKWRLIIRIIRLRQVYLSFSVQQCVQRRIFCKLLSTA